MNLINVNVIGLKPAQGIFHLPHDAGTTGVARYSSTLPLKSGLGGNQHVRAQATFGDCLAYDLLGTAESVDRGRVDYVDAMLEGGPDGRNRLSLVLFHPHIHPPMAQVPMATGDTFSDVPVMLQ